MRNIGVGVNIAIVACEEIVMAFWGMYARNIC